LVSRGVNGAACCECMPKVVGEKLSSMLPFPTPGGAAGPAPALPSPLKSEKGPSPVQRHWRPAKVTISR
jgi:hypothetical protein